VLAEVMASKGLVEAQAGKQTEVNVAFVNAREIYADPLGPSSERAAQLAYLFDRTYASARDRGETTSAKP